jgi:hypothetical protein
MTVFAPRVALFNAPDGIKIAFVGWIQIKYTCAYVEVRESSPWRKKSVMRRLLGVAYKGMIVL